MTLSRAQAAEAVANAAAERDTMQANLLELDASLGVRLLKGATLTGVSKTRWDEASATFGALWDLFGAYSGVVDQAAGLVSGRPGERALEQVGELLTGASVRVVAGPVPLAQRDIAATGTEQLTMNAIRTRMRTQFAQVAHLAEQAEQAWNQTAAQLEAVASELARADVSGDEGLTGEAAAIRADLSRLRDALNSDPLATSAKAAAPLRDRAADLAAKAAAAARLRATADDRIAAVTRAADAARAAHADVLAAADRAAARVIVRVQLPGFADPAPRLATLADLRAAGRWTRLAAELDLLESDLAAATTRLKTAERELSGLLATRDELRGLLDAYKVKAARLGAVEDLDTLHDQAHQLLWTAPCDLDLAEAAVRRYQHEVLARGVRR